MFCILIILMFMFWLCYYIIGLYDVIVGGNWVRGIGDIFVLFFEIICEFVIVL